MPRPQEELLEHLERAVRALADDPKGDHLGPLRYRPPQRFDRVRLPDRELLRIWRRDFFTCRYCGIRTIFTPVLRALSAAAHRTAVHFRHRPRSDIAAGAIASSTGE